MDLSGAFEVPILGKLFNFLRINFARHPSQDTTSTSHVDSPIKKLPPELIVLIVDYVPVVSGASLSLTCHSFYSSLKNRCLHPLKQAGDPAILDFLTCLERDLPTHVVCPSCVQLHPISSAEKYHLLLQAASTSRHELACWHRDWTSQLKRGTYAEFSSIVFHMAMKAYRQSHQTTQLLKLLGCGNHKLVKQGFVECRTAEARIQDGSLLLREQRVFLVPSSAEIPLPWCGGMVICPHIHFLTMPSLHKYGIQVPRASQIEKFENRQGLICCNHCHTEFRIDFKSYGKAGNAMFLTRWMDIGEGRNFNDYKFTKRLGSINEISWSEVAFRRGSICGSFEQQSSQAFKFDSLLSHQDEKNLCEKNPWPWPEGFEVTFVGVKQYYMVKNGRFVFLPGEEAAF